MHTQIGLSFFLSFCRPHLPECSNYYSHPSVILSLTFLCFSKTHLTYHSLQEEEAKDKKGKTFSNNARNPLGKTNKNPNLHSLYVCFVIYIFTMYFSKFFVNHTFFSFYPTQNLGFTFWKRVFSFLKGFIVSLFSAFFYHCHLVKCHPHFRTVFLY